MTNTELREAGRNLENDLIRACQSAVSRFEQETGLLVASIEVDSTRVETVGGEARTIIGAIRVHVEI